MFVHLGICAYVHDYRSTHKLVGILFMKMFKDASLFKIFVYTFALVLKLLCLVDINT
jgi:hypothetical protein